MQRTPKAGDGLRPRLVDDSNHGIWLCNVPKLFPAQERHLDRLLEAHRIGSHLFQTSLCLRFGLVGCCRSKATNQTKLVLPIQRGTDSMFGPLAGSTGHHRSKRCPWQGPLPHSCHCNHRCMRGAGHRPRFQPQLGSQQAGRQGFRKTNIGLRSRRFRRHVPAIQQRLRITKCR